MIENIKKFKSFIPESIWEYFRLRLILNSHAKVAAYWNRVLDNYVNGEIERITIKPKKIIENSDKIIWQYWSQGFSKNDVPDVVRICFDSVDKYKGDYTVVRLCDEDLNEYIELPDDVWEKYQMGIVGATHFSDLIRIALLTVYGGVWLDATILLTDTLRKDVLENNNWFLYQRDENQEDKKLWRRTYAYYFGWHKDFKVRMLSSIIYARPGSEVISDLFQLMLYYWKTKNKIIDYFFFQILFTQYIERFPERNCSVLSDCLPNMLQMYITGTYRKYTIQEILNKISIHKLSYKTVKAGDLKEFI